MNDPVRLGAFEPAARAQTEQLTQWKEQFQWELVRLDGRLERFCDHGCGHPVGHTRGFLTELDSVHGCCGCCRDWPHMAFCQS